MLYTCTPITFITLPWSVTNVRTSRRDVTHLLHLLDVTGVKGVIHLLDVIHLKDVIGVIGVPDVTHLSHFKGIRNYA